MEVLSTKEANSLSNNSNAEINQEKKIFVDFKNNWDTDKGEGTYINLQNEDPKLTKETEQENSTDRTTNVNLVLKKPSIEPPKSNEINNNSARNIIDEQPRVLNGLKVQVIETIYNENNEKNDFQTTCWYKLLSIICYWRVRQFKICIFCICLLGCLKMFREVDSLDLFTNFRSELGINVFGEKKMSDDVDKVQTARVQDSETWDIEKRSKYTVYKVVVHSGTYKWFVYRRYAEFHKLFESLKKQFPNLQLKLPGKKLFGNNLDPAFVAMRQDGLDHFVQELISHSMLLQLPEVREFFNLDNTYQSTENENAQEFNQNGDSKQEKLNLGPSERSHAKISDFELLRLIGEGSFGKVVLARHKSENKHYAVKVLNKKQVIRKNEAKHIMSERNVLLKTLNHPFLVGLHYSFQTTEKLYFVLDYVNGGELFFHLQKERVFSENRSRFYAAEMACALGYLHSKGIIYRDLKPENILLDAQGHIVLTDFGLSKEGLLGTDTTKTFCGTPEYLAPEIILKEPYDRSVDWWCLGTVLYEMLFGLPPFYCRDTSEMYDRILNKPLIVKTTISESARDILNKLLEKDRSKRLGSGYGDFDDVKFHPFFKQINWDHLVAKKIKPPFNPLVRGVMDFRNIDPQFTKEQVPASIEQSSEEYLSASVKEADDVFAEFSYPTAELFA